MVGLVPLLVRMRRVDRQHGVGFVTADLAGDLLRQLAPIDVFQHAVIVPQPSDVILGNAEDRAGILFFAPANFGQAFLGHVRIVRAGVVGRVDQYLHVIASSRQFGQQAAGCERLVVGVGRDGHHGLAGPSLDAVVARIFRFGHGDLASAPRS